MKKKIISLCVTILMAMAYSYGGVTLTVPDVSIIPGSTSNVVIYFDLGTPAYTAYQLDITYPEGISSVLDEYGDPAFQKGDAYGKSHSVSSIQTVSGKARFQCFDPSSKPLTAQSGTLLVLPIKTQKSLAEGTYQATISPIEFVQTDATPDRPDAITFNIVVSRSMVLDESSTVAPATAADVNITVRRTIKADGWNTICLPFSMTETQVKSCFGNDVQLADFKGYETVMNGAGKLVGIVVNFNSVAAIEANHPYIIKASADIQEFTVNGVAVAPKEAPLVAAVKRTEGQWSEMIGTYVANTSVPANKLFLSGNKFWYSTGKTTMKGYRAYFDFSDVLDSDYEVKISVDGIVDKVTGRMINEKSSDEDAYDLSGRKGNKAQRGVYIVNGKKALLNGK